MDAAKSPAKKKRKISSQDIQEAQMDVLAMEKQKISIEIENLRLMQEKIRLEVELLRAKAGSVNSFNLIE